MDAPDSLEFETQALVALEDFTTLYRSAPGKARKVTGPKKVPTELKPRKRGISESRKRLYHTNARVWLRDSRVLSVLCPALKSLSADMRSSLKALIKLLLPLSIAGVIAIPVDPYAYAALAVVVSSVALDTICSQQGR